MFNNWIVCAALSSTKTKTLSSALLFNAFTMEALLTLSGRQDVYLFGKRPRPVDALNCAKLSLEKDSYTCAAFVLQVVFSIF